MNEADRDPRVVLAESTPHLALVATRALYAEQPDLWDLGEAGRARTLEDFGHHLKALSTLDQEVFDAHVQYCVGLFKKRGFPLRWLEDAWRHMALVIEAELPAKIAEPATQMLWGTRPQQADVSETPV